MSDAQRDHRIDIWRGVALWMILWGHCIQIMGNEHAALRITPYYWLFSDALEVFVFLSGYAFGIAYLRTYQRTGWIGCQVKAVDRAWQLYAANALCLVAVLAIVGVFASHDAPASVHVAHVLENPALALSQFAQLLYLPWLFQILPLYVVMLLPMPLLLVLASRMPHAALGVSFALYAAVQFSPWLNMPSYENEAATWWFNPLAWQLLFVLGLLAAQQFHHGSAVLLRNTWLIAIAGIITVSPVLWRGATMFAARDLAGFGPMHETLSRITFPFNQGKGVLEPIRLIHFFAMAYFAAALLPAGLALWRAGLLRPLAWCGRHSLEVYCFGIVLTYFLGTMPEVTHRNLVATAAWAGGAIVVSVVFAWLLEQRRMFAKRSRGGT